MTLQQVIALALQASIVMTVFAFGLQATLADVLYVVRRPSLLGRSLVAMFVVMPIVAVALVSGFVLRPAVEAALLALAVSPIPPLLPSKERKKGGNVAYGLGLMVIVGALSIVFVPLAVELLGRYFLRPFAMPYWTVARIIGISTILPLAAGLVGRALLPAVAERVVAPVALVAKVLLVLALLPVLLKVAPAAWGLIGNGSIGAMIAFAVAGLAAGHVLGGPDPEHSVVLALSTATRHPAIALAVAQANFPDEPYLGASIILYFAVSILVGIPYLTWRQRHGLATA